MTSGYDIWTDYVSAYARLRWKRLALLCLSSVPVALLIAREAEFSYVVSEKVFVSINQSPALSGLTSASGGMGNLFGLSEKDTVLAEQSMLATSMPVFEAVRDIDPQLRAKAQGQLAAGLGGKLKQSFRSLQMAVFGEDYILNQEAFGNAAFTAFKENAKVEVETEAGVLSINYLHSEPLVGIRMVKGMVEALKELNKKIAADKNNARIAFLAGQIAEVRRDVDSRSDAIVAHINATNVSGEASTAVEQSYRMLADVVDQIAKTSIDINQRSVTIQESQKLKKSIVNSLQSEMARDSDGQINSMTDELRRFQAAMLKTEQSDVGGAMGGLSEQAKRLRERIKDELGSRETLISSSDLQKLLFSVESTISAEEQALAAAKQKLSDLRELRKQYESTTSKIPGAQAGLSKLKLDYAQRLKVLETLTMQYLQAQLEKDHGSSQLLVLEEPMLSTAKRFGKGGLMMISAALLASALIAASGLQSYLRRKVLLRAQLAATKQPSFLGAIPHLSKLESRNPIVAFRETGATFKLGGALVRMTSSQRKQGKALRVAITSSSSAVGKTIATLGIYEGLRARGGRCLVVDADFHASDRGLAKISAKHGGQDMRTLGELAQALATPSVTPLKPMQVAFVRAMDLGGEESELIQYISSEMPALVETASASFDWIIMDCGPFYFTSAAAILEQADVLIYCCEEGRTSMSEIEEFCLAIESNKAPGAQIFTVLTNSVLPQNNEITRESDITYYQKSKAA